MINLQININNVEELESLINKGLELFEKFTNRKENEYQELVDKVASPLLDPKHPSYTVNGLQYVWYKGHYVKAEDVPKEDAILYGLTHYMAEDGKELYGYNPITKPTPITYTKKPTPDLSLFPCLKNGFSKTDACPERIEECVQENIHRNKSFTKADINELFSLTTNQFTALAKWLKQHPDINVEKISPPSGKGKMYLFTPIKSENGIQHLATPPEPKSDNYITGNGTVRVVPKIDRESEYQKDDMISQVYGQ